MIEATEALRASLAKHRPARVHLYVGEELTRTLDVPTKGKKWEQIVNVADKLPWDRIELVSRAGSVLDVFTVQEETAEPPPVTDLALSKQGEREHELLKLLITAQDHALSARRADTDQALEALVKVVSSMGEQLKILTDIQALQLEAIRRARPAPATAAEKDEWDEALKVFQTIAPMLQLPHGKKNGDATKKETEQ